MGKRMNEDILKECRSLKILNEKGLDMYLEIVLNPDATKTQDKQNI